MTPEAHKALRESILHWTRLALDLAAPREDVGAGDCALCALFIEDTNCSGCPVAAATQAPVCRNTPYGRASKAVIHREDGAPYRQADIWAEVDFLRSLLPESLS